MDPSPSTKTRATSLLLGGIYILANLIRDDSLLSQNPVNSLFIFFSPRIRVLNDTTTFNSITKTPCPMKPSMLVSRGR